MSLPTWSLVLVTAASVAIASAVLSVFVVSRRWALIGEGIGHSGFGGAGTAWMLSLLSPLLAERWVPHACVILSCLGTALTIGFFTRRQRINSDAVIGIFMVASVAWGFLAEGIYTRITGREPVDWEMLLYGEMTNPSAEFAIAAVLLCIVVVIVVAMLSKEILYYCVDPLMAETSGVRVGLIHYLLLLLVTITILIGMRVAGALLVPALLILPGTTALVLSDKLRTAVIVAMASGIAGMLLGFATWTKWSFVPMGPAIVLALFVIFVAAYAGRQILRPQPHQAD